MHQCRAFPANRCPACGAVLITLCVEMTGNLRRMADHSTRPLRSGTCRHSDQGTYSLTVDIAIPMINTIKRKAEKIIMDTALEELKRRVEILA